MVKRKNCKGISTIIATILMILFVLIASGVVWVVIQNILSEQSEEIQTGLSRVILTISGSSVNITDDGVSLIINRDIGAGDLSGIKIILYNAEGESYSEDVSATLGELGSQKFSIGKGTLQDITKISIAPIIKSSSGQESLQRVTHTYNVN